MLDRRELLAKGLAALPVGALAGIPEGALQNQVVPITDNVKAVVLAMNGTFTFANPEDKHKEVALKLRQNFRRHFGRDVVVILVQNCTITPIE
jgi:hypothetical protein